MIETLEPFYARNLIVDEPYQVKSGKEGTMYRCRAHPKTGMNFLAAKIYRSREHRTFRNDAVYREGRITLDKRAARAIHGKTTFGREAQFAGWVEHEYETLRMLHDAGADVPVPMARTESAILMEYIGDEQAPARMLKHVQLAPAEAGPLFAQVLANIELMLRCDRIHGDLSAFNILYYRGRITIIDFPQSVDPRFNRQAPALPARDLTNVYSYWSRYGIRFDPQAHADELWWRFLHAQL